MTPDATLAGVGTDAIASPISTIRVVRSKLPWTGPIPVRYAVYVDDRLIGKLGPGEWLERRVGPGAHEVYVKAFFRQRSVTLVTEVGVGQDATVRCAFDPKAEAFDGPDGESLSIRIWREDGPVPEAFRRLPGTRSSRAEQSSSE